MLSITLILPTSLLSQVTRRADNLCCLLSLVTNMSISKMRKPYLTKANSIGQNSFGFAYLAWLFKDILD